MSVTGVQANAASNDYSNTSNATNASNELTMQDFFTLLAAQMSNQDMSNPVDSTAFISQMAQFSALTATQQLSSSFTNYMSVSYIGKNVKATQVDDNGNSKSIEGIAEKVEFLNGETYITVNGTRISPDEITEVSEVTE